MKYLMLMTALMISAVATAQSPPAGSAPVGATPAAATPAGATDDIAQNLFPPDLVLKYRDVIGLDEAQSRTLKGLVQKAQGRFLDLQWDMQAEVGKLVELVRPPRVDESAALAQVDKVLGMERDVKRAQISLLIQIKNLLNPAQQQKLSDLRSRSP
jgi:Spy/CpxP family protein refolding chaperone